MTADHHRKKKSLNNDFIQTSYVSSKAICTGGVALSVTSQLVLMPKITLTSILGLHFSYT